MVVKLFVSWVPLVMLPLLGFAVGAAASQGIWTLFGGVGLVMLMSSLRFLLPLFPVIAPIVYLFSDLDWLAVSLASLSMLFYLDSYSNFMHTKRQAELALADILHKDSQYGIAEVQITSDELKSFPSFAQKQWVQKQAFTLASKARLSPSQLAPYSADAFRVFRFWPLGAHRTIGAAVAYPLHRFSSLIFIRTSLHDLNDAQRLQLYHELAHGTSEGIEIMLRPKRWAAAAPMARIVHFVLAWSSVVAVYQYFGWRSIASLFLLVAGMSLRSAAIRHVNRISEGASEVLADSIALSHPDFAADSKWKIRASRLAMRLSDEIEYLGLSHPRAPSILFRLGWIKRWLNNGEILPYVADDVDPRLVPAAACYLAAGYLSMLPKVSLLTISWGSIGAALAMIPALGLFAKAGNVALQSVAVALDRCIERSKETLRQQTPA